MMEPEFLIRTHFQIVRFAGGDLNLHPFDSEEEYQSFCLGYLIGLRNKLSIVENRRIWNKLHQGYILSRDERRNLLTVVEDIDETFEVLPSTGDKDQDEYLKIYIKSFLLN